MAEKEDHTRRGGKKNSGKTERDPFLVREIVGSVRMAYFAYVDGSHEPPSLRKKPPKDEDKVDEFGLRHGSVYTLDAKKRWEIPEWAKAEESRTLTLLKEGRLKSEPLVLVTFVDEELHSNSKVETDSPFLKSRTEEELPVEVEVVKNRKGRTVVEKGSRSDQKKRETLRQNCKMMQERIPEAIDFQGDLVVYYVFDPKNVGHKEENFRRHRCRCERCVPKAGDLRGRNQVKHDTLSDNL